MTLGLFGMSAASNAFFFTIMLILMAVGTSLNVPTLGSLISKRGPADTVGYRMGQNQSMTGLGRAVGPAWGGWLYDIQGAAPFWATAVITTSVCWIGLQWHRKKLSV